MKLGEKITSAEEAIEELRSQVADIVKSAEDDGRDLLDEETDQIEALQGEIESAEKSLKGLKSAEKALALRTEKRTREREPQQRGFNTMVPARGANPEKPGALLAKAATVEVLAHIMKRSPRDIMVERYSHDNRVEGIYNYIAQKSATSTATTTAAGWAAELVESDVLDFVNELEAVSIYGAMAAGGVAIPFGNNNSVTMPHRTGSGNVSGAFVGENATIPVKQDNYGSTTFNRYKAAVISTFTNELARTSTPQVEALLRDAIRQDTGDMLDSVLCNPANAAVAGIRPASPWNGAANQASAGTTLADILTDLRFLMDTLSSANAGRAPRLIMNPSRLSGLNMLTNANGAFVFRDELNQGRLMGVPVIVSTNCPADHVFIVDLADFGTAFGAPEFDVSDQATLVMVNDDGTDPTMADTNAVSVAGSVKVSDAAGVVGGPASVKSMFQHWSVALRMVMPISWGMMRTGTAAYVTGVAW